MPKSKKQENRALIIEKLNYYIKFFISDRYRNSYIKLLKARGIWKPTNNRKSI